MAEFLWETTKCTALPKLVTIQCRKLSLHILWDLILRIRLYQKH